MYFTYQLFRCPNCNRLLFFRILKFLDFIKGYSGLGPSLIRCAKCGTQIDTGNVEWPDMSNKSKIYLCFITIVYSWILGLLSSLVILYLVDIALGLQETTIMSNTTMVITSINIGMLFIFLQLIRIIASILRENDKVNALDQTSFFNLHTNFQGLGMIAVFICMIMSIILYILGG